MRTTLQRELKNFIHNTLGITKDDIRTMVEGAVERIVERKLDTLFREKFNDQYQLQRIIDDSIKQNITRHNWYWGQSEDTLDDYVKKEVVRQLLEGVKLKVDVAKTKKEATESPQMTRVIRRGHKI